jgi:hypothetical protein
MTKKYLFIGMAAILGASLSFFACESATDGTAGATGRLGDGHIGGEASAAGLQAMIDRYDGTGAELVLDNVALTDTDAVTVDFKSVRAHVVGTFATEGTAATTINAARATVTFADGAEISLASSDDILVGAANLAGKVASGSSGSLVPVVTEAELEDATGKAAIASFSLDDAADIPAGVTDLYVYDTLTVTAASTAPTGNVVALNRVSVSGAIAAAQLTNVNLTAATIVSGGTATTITAPASALTVKAVEAGSGGLTLAGATGLSADVTGAGTLTLSGAVTAANITGDGNIVFTNAEVPTAFTGSGSLGDNPIKAATITFTNGFSTSQYAKVTLDGAVTIPAGKAITFGHVDGIVTLKQDTTVKVGTTTLLTATTDTVLTAGTANAALTTTAAVTGEPPSPAKLTLSAQALTLTSGTLTVAANAEFVVSAALTVGAGATLNNAGTVTLSNSVNLVLTGDTTTGGAKLTGAGAVVSGPTSIVGASGWQAVRTSDSANITIAGGTNGATITGGANVALTALGAGATITQNAGGSNNLTISANTVIDLKGTASAAAGSIVLVTATDANVAKITLTGSGAKILAGTGADAKAVLVASLRTGLAAGGATGATAGNDITAKAPATGASTLTQIIGADDNNTVTGPTSSATANCVINGTIAVTGEN